MHRENRDDQDEINLDDFLIVLAFVFFMLIILDF